MIDICLSELPFVLYKNRDQLPIHPAIYFCILESSRVIYIGETKNLLFRFWHRTSKGCHSKHLYFKDYEDQGLKIAYFYSENLAQQFQDAGFRRSIEKPLIKAFCPTLNTTLPYNRFLGEDWYVS